MDSFKFLPTVSQLKFVAETMGLKNYESYIVYRIQGYVIQKHNYLLSDKHLENVKNLIMQCVTKRDMTHYLYLGDSPIGMGVLELLKADVIASNSTV